MLHRRLTQQWDPSYTRKHTGKLFWFQPLPSIRLTPRTKWNTLYLSFPEVEDYHRLLFPFSPVLPTHHPVWCHQCWGWSGCGESEGWEGGQIVLSQNVLKIYPTADTQVDKIQIEQTENNSKAIYIMHALCLSLSLEILTYNVSVTHSCLLYINNACNLISVHQ